MENKVEAVSSMSVLNVIPEVAVRLMHLVTLKTALMHNGKAYIKIWPGEGEYKGTSVPTLEGENYQANAKAERFLREVELVFGTGNAKIHNTIPNLIIAENNTIEKVAMKEIKLIQKQEEQDTKFRVSSKSLIAHCGSMFNKPNEISCESPHLAYNM
jgi:hypothetical protein